MLSHLSCRNYRSLEGVDVPLEPVTAFVGPNGSGKTSLLRAIDLVCGEAWPTMRSIRIPQDFTAFDTSRELAITITLDPPLQHEDALGTTRQVRHLQVRCLPYKRSGKWGEAGDLHLEFEPLDHGGEVPTVAIAMGRGGPVFRPLTVSTGLRDEARIIHIDHRRSVVQHLPTTRGSVLGRLFEPARRELDQRLGDGTTPRGRFREAYEAAMEAVRTPRIQEVEETIRETAKRMLGFLGASATREVDVSLGFTDPANPFASLRLRFIEDGLEIPGEELGLGVQSALVVGVFEALRRLGGPVGTVVIEEPEMYLHPQAQRYFYRLLTEMADAGECQVIYSTHSPIFADVERFEALRLVRKEPGAMTTVAWFSDPSDVRFLTEHRGRMKVAAAFDPTRSELLFARRVLLVEGPGDRIAAHLTAGKMGLDLDAEGLTVVPCGSKESIPFYARTCRGLQIPFFVLHDEDVLPEEDEEGDAERNGKAERIREANARARRVNGEILEAVGDASRVFVISPSLERVLGIGEQARDKPRRVAEELTDRPLEEYPRTLLAAVEALASGDGSTAY